MANDNWFYAREGQQFGPTTLDDLRQRVLSGELRPADLVWTEGRDQWIPVAAEPQLAAALPAGAGPGPAASPYPPAGYPTAAPTLDYYAPQQVRYAGFWLRFVAYIIDYIVTFVIGLPLGVVLGFFLAAAGADLALIEPLSSLLGLTISWLYFALMESSSRQATLGKMALGLTVTDLDGQRISFGRATGRFFAKIISALILMIGFIMAAFTDRKQALHDIIANTLVVRSN